MSKTRLAAVVSAVMLAAVLGSPVRAQATLEQLNEMADILSANDVSALEAFIEDNPELLEGEEPIAVLLRRFVEELKDLPTFLAVNPNLSESLGFLARETLQEGSDAGDDTLY